MSANRLACCLLLAVTVVVSGCQENPGLVGMWDMGRSNFHFREDGLLFYRTSRDERYQGRYYYDSSTTPGVVRAQLEPMNGGSGRPISLQLQVKFLTPNYIQFDGPSREGNRTMLASRVLAR